MNSSIDIRKIVAGISEFHKKKKMKVTGSVLFDFIAKSKVEASDDVLNKIEDNKTLKNQPPLVLEFFTKHFINVEVENVTNKQRVAELIETTHKKFHLPYSAITPKSIMITGQHIALDKIADLNIFKTPIEDWKEEQWQEILIWFKNATGVEGTSSSDDVS